MRRALWLMALALPLAAQPKLLTNGQLDTHSAAAGLEPAFRALLAAQPQPAWIGYTVPAVRTYSLGCEFVSHDDGQRAGVVHLEPPDHAVILFRVVSNAVERIRALSPDCEIDAGGVPVHWLTDVRPADSVALLVALAGRDLPGTGAVGAIAMHSGAAADGALDRFLAADQTQAIRLRAVSLMGSTRGRSGVEKLQSLMAGDSDERVRERAASALGASREPEALDALLAAARADRDPRLRARAVSELGRKSGPWVVSAITGAIQNDPDMQVKRRAVSALQSLPDGQGIPILIELVKTAPSPEIRKQAMSALENTHDPRALAFFEQVLK